MPKDRFTRNYRHPPKVQLIFSSKLFPKLLLEKCFNKGFNKCINVAVSIFNCLKIVTFFKCKWLFKRNYHSGKINSSLSSNIKWRRFWFCWNHFRGKVKKKFLRGLVKHSFRRKLRSKAALPFPGILSSRKKIKNKN